MDVEFERLQSVLSTNNINIYANSPPVYKIYNSKDGLSKIGY